MMLQGSNEIKQLKSKRMNNTSSMFPEVKDW